MKHLNTLVALAIATTAQAQFQNGGFEDICADGLPRYWKWVSDPLVVVIDTGVPEVLVNPGGRYELLNTNVHSGQHALEMGNGMNLTTGAPLLGRLSASWDTIFAGGFPIETVFVSERPATVDFFAEYLPASTDTAFVVAEVRNEADETIGSGTLRIGGTVSPYAAFTLPISYTSADPAMSMTLTFRTSTPTGVAALNTVLRIDDVQVTYEPNSVAEAAAQRLSVRPNPATDRLILGLPTGASGPARVVDMLGRSTPVALVQQQVDVTGFPEGRYVLQVANARGWLTAPFVVAR
jgi:hypothetical protein